MQAQAIYEQGYNSGHQAGRRAGYEQALQDSSPTYAESLRLITQGQMRKARALERTA